MSCCEKTKLYNSSFHFFNRKILSYFLADRFNILAKNVKNTNFILDLQTYIDSPNLSNVVQGVALEDVTKLHFHNINTRINIKKLNIDESFSIFYNEFDDSNKRKQIKLEKYDDFFSFEIFNLKIYIYKSMIF